MEREYAYWALGHVHIRQQAVEGLPVWYSGNLQGRNPRETGPKGGWVVEARAGVPATPRFQSFAPIRWERLEIDDLEQITTIDGLASRLGDAVNSVSDGQTEVAVRIVLSGACPRAAELRDAEALDEIAEDVAMRTDAVELQLRAEGLYLPIAIEARMPRITTTISSSMSVKPFFRRNILAPGGTGGIYVLRLRSIGWTATAV